MSTELQLVCYIVAFVLFVLGAANAPVRPNLIAAGLAAWVLVPLALTLEAV
jgi:hypothetical protein